MPPLPFEDLQGAPEAVYGRLDLPPAPPDRPFTYVNMAMTLDGKVTVGRPGYLLSGSPGDRRAMDELRAASDAVMVGAGTLRHENPVLRVRSADLREWRLSLGLRESPRYVVVTRSGSLPPDLRFFGEEGGVVVTRAGLDAAVLGGLESRAQVLACGEAEVDLAAALRRLRDDLGVRRLLVEGGPTLTFSLLAADLVDEIFVTLSPLLKGGRDTPTLLEGEGFAYPDLRRVRLLSAKHHEGELYLRYSVRRS